jgi:hypothetical protein
MAFPSLVGDVLAPAWAALTPAQRSSWHSYAASTPVYNLKRRVVALNGWQMWVHVNSILATADAGLILPDPPPDLVRPSPVPLAGYAIRGPHVGPDGKTYTAGRIYLYLNEPTPADRVLVVLNNVQRVSRWSARPWYPTKRTAILPGTTGWVDLTGRVGYTLAGPKWLKRMEVRGPGFLAHPAGMPVPVWTVSTVNGQRAIGTLSWTEGTPRELVGFLAGPR